MPENEVLERLIDERNALIGRVKAAEAEAEQWRQRYEEVMTLARREAKARQQAAWQALPLPGALQ